MTKETGGSAFPIPISEGNYTNPWNISGGMALRDWFAGQAMRDMKDLHMNMNDFQINNVARLAYTLADALIEARKS